MNIFFLHFNPKKCAKYHVDRHVVKMILEYAQLLCTAIWLTCSEAKLKNNSPAYKKTHENHPSAKWVRKSKSNWLWLHKLSLKLCKEYTHRYGKTHKTESVLRNLQCPPLPDKKFTDPPQAMPDEFKDQDTITAYRNYYLFGKKHLHRWKTRHAWKNRNPPNFILEIYPEL